MSDYARDKIANLLKTQQSLTEWLEDIQHDNVDQLKVEDNDKRVRIGKLGELIGLPHERTTSFTGRDLADRSEALVRHLHKYGNELCALRLIPLEKGLPKLRMRGKTVRDAYEWFKEQEIDPDQYRADYIQHPLDNKWATIFVVGPKGIFGEIVWGGHQQLTQGFHDADQPIVFTYDYSKWKMSEENEEVLNYLKMVLAHIHVTDEAKQEELAKELGSTFTNGYINGYWETADATIGLWFIDYNQSLGELYSQVDVQTLLGDTSEKAEIVIRGMRASPGVASGKVQIVHPDEVETCDFKQGNVLVCEMTSPDYVPLMQKASAVITDMGGILSHAAIVARELKKPCIVGTREATKMLKNQDFIRVDGDNGTVLAGK